MLPCGCIVCNDDLHKHIHRITWLKYVKENISTTGTLTISLQGQAFGFTHTNVWVGVYIGVPEPASGIFSSLFFFKIGKISD